MDFGKSIWLIYVQKEGRNWVRLMVRQVNCSNSPLNMSLETHKINTQSKMANVPFIKWKMWEGWDEIDAVLKLRNILRYIIVDLAGTCLKICSFMPATILRWVSNSIICGFCIFFATWRWNGIVSNARNVFNIVHRCQLLHCIVFQRLLLRGVLIQGSYFSPVEQQVNPKWSSIRTAVTGLDIV